jgi:hypothetical protein
MFRSRQQGAAVPQDTQPTSDYDGEEAVPDIWRGKWGRLHAELRSGLRRNCRAMETAISAGDWAMVQQTGLQAVNLSGVLGLMDGQVILSPVVT